MIATSFTRHTCKLSERIITYTTLRQWYVCNECGGQIVHGFDDTGDWAKCADCGSRDFISESSFTREVVEAWEVEQGLPEHLRVLLGPQEPKVSATQAIAELFD